MKKKKVCPGLSLVYDNSKHWIIANPFHKCDFQVKPERVSLLHQDIYCLSENHINCPIYLKASLLHPHKTTPITNTNPRITIPFLRSKSLTFRQKVYLLYFLWIVVLIIWTVIAKIGPFSFLKPISVSEGNQNTELIDSLTPERNSTNISVNAQLTDQENKVPLLSSSTTRTPTRTSTQTTATDLSSTLPLCVKPNGWIVYTVEPLVTLEMLSNWTNTSEEDLMEANCLITTELVVGQRIFLPKFPVFPAVTHTPYPTPIHNSPLVTPTATVIPTRTSTIIPTPTSTKNPLFKDTPTPPMIPPTTTPVATDTPIPTDVGTP